MQEQNNGKQTHQDEGREERAKTFTRRRLLQVGWTVPVIVALEMSRPKTAFAQGGGSHIDFTDHGDSWPYWDAPHLDVHVDYYLDHSDSHNDSHYDLHEDGPHIDLFSLSNENDSVHDDVHHDVHEDKPRTDVTSHEDHLDHIDS